MTSATMLSIHDNAILSALFDPEASLAGAPRIEIQTTAVGVYSLSETRQIQNWEGEALLLINTDNPSRAEVRTVIAEFDKIVSRYPHYASAYNNRAQARRMQYEIDELANHPEELLTIIDDLSRAMELATPSQPSATVSPETAKVLASAHTHRAYLFYRASHDELLRKALSSIKGTTGLNGDALEELASKDFSIGGRYGNKIAKQLAVKTNPYAKLCGSIVKEALQKEIETYWSTAE